MVHQMLWRERTTSQVRPLTASEIGSRRYRNISPCPDEKEISSFRENPSLAFSPEDGYVILGGYVNDMRCLGHGKGNAEIVAPGLGVTRVNGKLQDYAHQEMGSASRMPR